MGWASPKKGQEEEPLFGRKRQKKVKRARKINVSPQRLLKDEKTKMPPIVIKSLDGTQKTMTVTLRTTVDELKTMIYNTDGYPPDQQRLVFNGREMYEERTMEDYCVSDSSVIHLILRLRGGMMHMSSGRGGTGIPNPAPLSSS